MSLEHWEPFQEMLSLRDAMSQLFQESVVRPTSMMVGRTGWVTVDIADADDAYEVRATLPGVKPDDVRITVAGDTLTIRGEAKADEERKERAWIVRESRTGAFARTITLPMPVDADAAVAHFEHGILTLRLPKSAPARPKRIKVNGEQAAHTIPASPADLPTGEAI